MWLCTGTIWTAIAHIITGVMGAGVLSLGWSLAQLGWLFGPPAIVVFAAVTLVSTSILSDCYRSPHSHHGPDRNGSFIQAVNYYLGQLLRLIIYSITLADYVIIARLSDSCLLIGAKTLC